MSQASGNEKLFYIDSAGGSVTETFSATATGDNSEDALKSLYSALSTLVQNYLNTISGYSDVKIDYYDIQVIPIPSPTPTIELYYNLIINEVGQIINQQIVNILTRDDTYCAITCQTMVNKNGELNGDCLSFIGTRTKADPVYDLKPMYNESFNILMQDGSFFEASMSYVDPGEGFVSTVPYIIYDISSSSGIFSTFKHAKIIINNSNPRLLTRKIVVY